MQVACLFFMQFYASCILVVCTFYTSYIHAMWYACGGYAYCIQVACLFANCIHVIVACHCMHDMGCKLLVCVF